MELFAFQCGMERTTRAMFDPFDEDCGALIDVPHFFYLIRHPQGLVLFDTGADGDDVAGNLRSVGVEPGDVSHVILSHLHYDHAGNVQLFDAADVYVSAAELAFANDPPVYQREAYVALDSISTSEWRLVTGEHDLFGDGRIRMIPTPGHTAGHQSLLVKLPNEPCILVGDAAYDPDKMQLRRLPAVLWSPDQLVSSWQLLEQLQDREDATLLFTHDIAFESRVKTAPERSYR